jgi:hypothetical protein
MRNDGPTDAQLGEAELLKYNSRANVSTPAVYEMLGWVEESFRADDIALNYLAIEIYQLFDVSDLIWIAPGEHEVGRELRA